MYEVLNGVLEALPIEISLLRRGDVTWRFPYARLEYICRIPEYLSPQGRIILRDFIRANPDASGPFETHDTRVEELTEAAGEAYRALLERAEFQTLVRKALAEYMGESQVSESTVQRREYPGGAFPITDFPKLVAEHVVNSIREIASHHTDSDFWRLYGDSFLRLGTGPEFERLRGRSQGLVKFDEWLTESIDEKRFALCEEFDIPAAPVGTFAGEI